MSNATVSYESIKSLTESRFGENFSAAEEARFGHILNDEARALYDRNDFWPRWLTLEPRSVVRGYIADEEDGFHVYGADTAKVNGLYSPDGNDYANADNYKLEAFVDAMVVEGAGSTEGNGVYLRDGDADDRPNYRLDATWVIRWIEASSNWVVMPGGDPDYNSTEDVATPDLVETWLQGSGDLPVPTVRRATLDDAGITADYVTWRIVDSDGNVVYTNPETSLTPSLDGWTGSNLGPLVQPLGKIERILWQFDGEKWSDNSSNLLRNYRDKNGIRSTNGSGVVWVAYKAQIDTYGDGTGDTVADIPKEFSRYIALSAAYTMSRANRQGNSDATYAPAYAQVEAAAQDALIGITREGAWNTIMNFHETYYSYDQSIR